MEKRFKWDLWGIDVEMVDEEEEYPADKPEVKKEEEPQKTLEQAAP